MLFAYLATHRDRGATPGELAEALWPYEVPDAVEVTLRAVTSRLRRVLGDGVLQGRGTLQLVLAETAWIDVEAANEAIHRAQAAVESGRWQDAWAPCHIALNVSRRTLLPGLEAPWIDDLRQRLEDVRLRALQCWTATGLGIGGPELADAESAARALVREAPLRETGYTLLMRVLDARGNPAEAIRAYEQLRERLQAELGMTPGPAARELHTRILLREHEPPAQPPPAPPPAPPPPAPPPAPPPPAPPPATV